MKQIAYEKGRAYDVYDGSCLLGDPLDGLVPLLVQSLQCYIWALSLSWTLTGSDY